MNRKKFLKNSFFTSMALISFSGFSKNVSISDSLVKEFVIAGHNDLIKVKEMIEVNPSLIYSQHNWGNGDFESAIEGAGHVGNQDIVNFLLSRGARINLFGLTMLGKTEIVKSTLKLYPELLYSKGPHGFTLLHHAKVGGLNAKPLFTYLAKLGLKDYKLSLE